MLCRWRKYALVAMVPILLQPAAPRAEGTGLSLDDLGFSESQTKGDPDLQVVLEKRSRMLKTHQILGLITAAPMLAAAFSGEGAGEEGGRGSRDRHAILGATAGTLYFTTAYFSWRAPPGPAVKKTGATRFHRSLAFVHFPAMVAAPILGYQAYRQRDRGEAVHGAAKHHASAAGLAAGAYAASIAVLWFNF